MKTSPFRTTPRTRASRGLRALAALTMAALLSACGSVGSLGSSGLSPALEQQRAQLARTFDGTPVVVAAEGRDLRVTVPLKNSFGARQYTVKPGLAKVLEKLAPGVARQAAQTLQVLPPGDPQASPELQRERRESLQDMARGLGVPLQRLQVSTDTSPDGLTVLRVVEGAR